MKKKKKWIIAIALLAILMLICIMLFWVFGREKTFTVYLNTDGGTVISDIKIKDGEVIKLPEEPTKEGYVFVGWTNKEGNIVTEGMKVTEDITLKASWISKDAETVTAEFDTDGGNKVGNIILEKGNIILLPVTPIKEGYVFVGWQDEKGNIVVEGMNVNKNITLKALWIKKDSKTVTVNFDTDGGSKIGNIIIENGKVVLLPIAPTKEGYVFAGWVDEDGNEVTTDTKVDKDITLKALWKKPYSCPADCTPSEDGKTCTKIATTEVSKKDTCPSGYTMSNGQCLNYNKKYNFEMVAWEQEACKSNEYMEVEEDGYGATRWCIPKANKISAGSCPSGYTKDGNICKKTETINCTKND